MITIQPDFNNKDTLDALVKAALNNKRIMYKKEECQLRILPELPQWASPIIETGLLTFEYCPQEEQPDNQKKNAYSRGRIINGFFNHAYESYGMKAVNETHLFALKIDGHDETEYRLLIRSTKIDRFNQIDMKSPSEEDLNFIQDNTVLESRDEHYCSIQ